MGAGMNDLDEIRARHKREVIAVHESHGEEAWCPRCEEHWPCDAAHLLTLLAERDAQVAAVRELHAPEDFSNRKYFVARSPLRSTEQVCRECGGNDAEYPAPWPCPTTEALDAKGGAK